ncbi:MAG: FlgD immunoglobulin-like domain containing protein [Candidatus Woesearchaeota archaeon]|jgi:Tol biopolymer transport system component|nr:FlgD immunoglobulin-like domain containing protein [Candidatus Woesearchaeota archaeon]
MGLTEIVDGLRDFGERNANRLRRFAYSSLAFGIAATGAGFATNARAQGPNMFVDDSNVSGIEDGSRAHPFDTMQEGVDAVADGGTVNVASGRYDERISVTKSLSLIGEDPETTVVYGVQGESFILALLGGEHNVRGFTFRSSGSHTGIYSQMSGSIENCLFVGNRDGVSVGSGGNVDVTNNTFYRNLTGIDVIGNPSSQAEARIRNNILVGSDVAGLRGSFSSILFAHNCLSGNSQDFFDYTLSPDDVGNVFADPLFVSDTDFHLQLSSPAIGSGDVNGVSVDMGVYGGTNAPGVRIFIDMSIDNTYSLRVTENRHNNTVGVSIEANNPASTNENQLIREAGLLIPTRATLDPQNVGMYYLDEGSWYMLGERVDDGPLLPLFYEAYKVFLPPVAAVDSFLNRMRSFFEFIDSGREDIVRPRDINLNSGDYINLLVPFGSAPITRGLRIELPNAGTQDFFFKFTASQFPVLDLETKMEYGIEIIEGQSPIITKQRRGVLIYHSVDREIFVEYYQVDPTSPYTLGESGEVALDIPAFSLDRAMTVGLERLVGNEVPDLDGALSPAFRVTPDDLDFNQDNQPTLRMRYSDVLAAPGRAMRLNQQMDRDVKIFHHDGSQWSSLDTVVDGNFASAEISGGGMYAVGVEREVVIDPIPSNIMFIAQDSTRSSYELYSVDPFSQRITQLTRGLDIRDQEWSPDGSGVIVYSAEKRRAIIIPDVNNGNILEMPDEVMDDVWNYRWSPDGSKIATLRPDGLYLIDTEGIITELVRGGVWDHWWNPDGESIIYSGGSRERSTEIINIDGSERRRFTEDIDGYLYWLTFSPDRSQLAAAQSPSYYVMDTDGSGVLELYNHPTPNAMNPLFWFQDGGSLFFYSSRERPAGFYSVDSDGRNLQPLLEEYWDYTDFEGLRVEPQWGQGGIHGTPYSSSPDGTMLAFIGFSTPNMGIHVYDIEERRVRRLTEDLRPILGDIQWSRPINHLILGEESLPYDTNGDDRVDIVDLVTVARAFGNYSPEADVNGDGRVDIVDLVTVASHFGEIYGNAAPSIVPRRMLPTGDTVNEWLEEAREHPGDFPEYRRGVAVLERLAQVSAPEQTNLLPNYPNPFNPETWMPFELAETSDVTIRVYDPRGDVVRTLNLGQMPAGTYSSPFRAPRWDGRNDLGENVGSGLYIMELNAGDHHSTRRMLMVK